MPEGLGIGSRQALTASTGAIQVSPLQVPQVRISRGSHSEDTVDKKIEMIN